MANVAGPRGGHVRRPGRRGGHGARRSSTIPGHPYTWALLASLPQLGVKGEDLYSIKGTPPSLFKEIAGDAFAPRNPRALEVDFDAASRRSSRSSPTHWARTWLLDPAGPEDRSARDRPAPAGPAGPDGADDAAKGGPA
ncbi:MAG: hypothetical protein MZV65_15930 [Chromatiales bacterium]|nr:hypothetical protein [Chromatiales bacterium]